MMYGEICRNIWMYLHSIMILMLLSMTNECVVLLCMLRNTAQSIQLHGFCFTSSRAVLFHLFLHSLFFFYTILKQIPDIFCLKNPVIYLWKRTILFFTLLFLIYDFLKNLQMLRLSFFFFLKKFYLNHTICVMQIRLRYCDWLKCLLGCYNL